MYISKVEIENFRNFRRFNVRLNQYSVIVGSNKSGKTNLLHAIRLAIDPAMRPTDRILDQTDIWDGPIQSDEDRIVTIVVELALADTNEIRLMSLVQAIADAQTARFMYRFPVRSAASIQEIADQNSLSDTNNSQDEGENKTNRTAYTWVAGKEGQEQRVNVEALLNCLSFEALNAFRDAEGLLGSWSRTPLHPLLKSLGIDDERLKEIAGNVRTQAEELRKEHQVDELVRRINKRSSDMVGPIFATAVSRQRN